MFEDFGIFGDTLYTVLLNDYSRTCVPTFIQICSYLTDTRAKISLHVFLRHNVYVLIFNIITEAWR